LRALGSPDPSAFLKSHPAALAFVQPRPIPSSFAREKYFGISAFRFTNRDGVTRHGRYHIIPEAGVEALDDAAAKTKDRTFLFDELARIIFDPIPRVEGIEPSDDPLFELRAAIYLMSGRRRRQAPRV
jgi:catalase